MLCLATKLIVDDVHHKETPSKINHTNWVARSFKKLGPPKMSMLPSVRENSELCIKWQGLKSLHTQMATSKQNLRKSTRD